MFTRASSTVRLAPTVYPPDKPPVVDTREERKKEKS